MCSEVMDQRQLVSQESPSEFVVSAPLNLSHLKGSISKTESDRKSSFSYPDLSPEESYDGYSKVMQK